MTKETKETIRTVASVVGLVIQAVGLFLLVLFRAGMR